MLRPQTARWVLPLTAVAQLVLALDFAIVNVALSTIQHELHFPASGLQWVATGYALTFGAFLMAGGRLGDRFGLRRVLLVGLAVFGLASLTGGLAQSPVELVVSRLAQGAGAALVAPNAFGLVSGAHPRPATRARAISLFQASNAVGGLAGVLLGGLLTGSVGWRWVLLINPPVVLVIGILTLVHIAATPGRPGTPVDGAGGLTLSAAIAALILGVGQLQQHGLGSPRAWETLLLAAVAVVAFMAAERRSTDPMLPGSLLARRRWTVLVATLVLGGTMGGYAYLLALYLQRDLHLSPAAAGFAFIPATLTGLITSTQVAPRLLPRLGWRTCLVLAMSMLALGQLWLARIPPEGDYATDVLVGVLPTAAGLGLAFPAAALLLTDRVPEHQRGVAGALFPTGQQIGSAIGLAVLATVAAAPAAGLQVDVGRAFLATAIATGLVAAMVAALGPRATTPPPRSPPSRDPRPAGDGHGRAP